MTYVIKRTDQGGGYVCRPGPANSYGSYTQRLQGAQQFQTREAAEKERCPGNEVVLPMEDA